MITLNLTEIENHAEVGTKIAKGFTKFSLDEKHNHPEKLGRGGCIAIVRGGR
jgi:hypothetical protein